MLYLYGHTCPDIYFEVNFFARYMFCPNNLHEESLKQIGQYLKLTWDCGLIMNPNRELFNIDGYPDADFLECMDTRSQMTPPMLIVALVTSSKFQTVLFYGIQSYRQRQSSQLWE